MLLLSSFLAIDFPLLKLWGNLPFPHKKISALADDLIYQPIGLGFFSRHKMIPLTVTLNPFHAPPGIGGQDGIQLFLYLQYLFRLDLDIGALALAAAGGLVYHYL